MKGVEIIKFFNQIMYSLIIFLNKTAHIHCSLIK